MQRNKHIIFSLLTRVVLIFSGIATSVLTARALGVSGRGEYFYIITLVTLACQFGNFGLASSNTYLLAKDHSLLPRLAANNFWISLIVGTLLAYIVLVLETGETKSHSTDNSIWLLFIMIPTMLYGLLSSNLFIAMLLVNHYNLYQLGSATIQLVGVVIAAWMLWGVWAFILVSALISLIGAGVLMLMLSKLTKLTWRVDLKLFYSNISYSGKAYFATLFAYGVSRAGVLLLSNFAGKEEIGIYSIAIQFADALMILPSIVAMLLLPDLLKGDSKHHFARTISAVWQVALVMAVLCALTGLIAAWIVPNFFGVAFAPAVQVLWWMLPGVFSLSLASVILQYLAANGIPLATVWIWLGGLLFLLAISAYSIPHWGALGAAGSLSLTYILLSITLIMLAYRHYGVESKASA